MKNSFKKVAANEANPKWNQMVKRQNELYESLYTKNTIRSEFERDYNRIINCNAYKRLKHKTQVFFSPKNDHICTRSEHVMLVESISYTIAKYLGLNTELTKAISTAHDLGHAPFGHQGEKIISEIYQSACNQKFWHEKNGLHLVDHIELLKDYDLCYQNLNLTYAVRDGIISHCGEIDENGIKPRENAIPLEKYSYPNEYAPFTWEACVVKIADKIAYIGRDIEDAISRGLICDKDVIKIDKITPDVRINNSNIINYFVHDICQNSSIEEGIKLSPIAMETLNKIKQFNYEKIYFDTKIEPSKRYFKLLIHELYFCLREMYDGENTFQKLKKMDRFYPSLSKEFIDWLKNYTKVKERDETIYKNQIIYDLRNPSDYYKAVLDYIAGMTDNYIIEVYNEIVCF